MKIINGYAGSYGKLISFGRILAALSALVALIPYYDIWKIIRIAVKGEELAGIRPAAWNAVMGTVISLLMYVAALMCTHIAAFRVQANMRSTLMRRILTLPLGVFDSEGTGKIRRTVNESTAATETYIAHNLPDKAVAAATPIGLVVLLFAFDWRIGLICLIPVVMGFAFMMTMMGRNMQEKMSEYQNALDTMSSEATEYVRGIPVVKTFGQTVHSFRRFKEAIDNFGVWATDYTVMLRGRMIGFMTCINAIFVFLVVAAYMFTRGGTAPETILNIMYYIIVTPLLTVTLTKVAYSGEQEMVVVDALSRIESILDMQPLEEAKDGRIPENHAITLSHVSYRYKDSAGDAVSDLSLRINAGEHVAFVGPSGGGKTTTAALIARFFDVDEGEILIGGINIREIRESELMKLVSFVFQDSRLFKTSILENVRMARPSATEDEVMEALKKAQCMDIIDKLPLGIHTVLGSEGTYLSGGEQQRISIARAILKDAPILILDEATAFADPDNETKMQAAFEELGKNKTMIMIAHRLSTVVDADRIFVLKDGSVCESGSHDELMDSNGLYRKMFEEYTRSAQWKVGA
ncbi:MAG: ABC transporter ATP-binding protein [Lachnospiraceae bacterium]|nr:ABC transporter ATP-binding protein [Lachnospiraceae bacterium]